MTFFVLTVTGEVIINPTDEQAAQNLKAVLAYAKQKAEWALLKDAQTVTADGKHFELAASICVLQDTLKVITTTVQKL